MTTFDTRQQAFENKYAHDLDFAFKVNAKRNYMLGIWVAERLGKTAQEADAYAKEVVLADFEKAGDQDVYRKVMDTLSTAGVHMSENELLAKMHALLDEAKKQLGEG